MENDCLGSSTETVYRENQPELWTSQFTLIERLSVAYREDRDTGRVVTNATNLVEVRGDAETVIAATTYVEDHGFTPFDALHLVESEGDSEASKTPLAAGAIRSGDTIVPSDEAYEGVAPRLDLKTVDEE